MALPAAAEQPARRPPRSRWTPAGSPTQWCSVTLVLCSVAIAAQAGGLSTATCNSRLVQSSGQLATALATPDASVLQLSGLTRATTTDTLLEQTRKRRRGRVASDQASVRAWQER